MTVTQICRRTRRPPQEAPPQTQRVHDAAQNLADELRRFRRDWPYFPQLAKFELVVSDDLLAALNRLSAELRRNHYAAATPLVSDQQWLAKLSKMQESIPRVESAAQLLREMFSPAERLRTLCQKLLDASKTWPVEFQNSLHTAIDGLRNFVEGNGLHSRIDMLERQLARERQLFVAGVVEDRSASLEAELAEARKVKVSSGTRRRASGSRLACRELACRARPRIVSVTGCYAS